GNSVCPRRSLRNGLPTNTRLAAVTNLGTAANPMPCHTELAARQVGFNAVLVGRSSVHVVIMGCGRVGASLAAALERLGHDVAVIDKNQQAFRRLGSDFHGEQVVGIGFDRQVLVQAASRGPARSAAVPAGPISTSTS